MVGNVEVNAKFAIKEHFMSADCERDPLTSRVVYSNPVRARVEASRKDFIAEANRLHKVGVTHRNIVRVNEVFELNNTAYYVMEYLDGQSLRAYVKERGALEEAEMLGFMAPIIDAVRSLHAARMTHLDIKPDNIMLAKGKGGALRPVLIDFGLSKHYDKDGHPTSTINILGCSDGYAPIEQYSGITTFSPGADIYALGATMAFCLTGRDPQKSTELLGQNLAERLPEEVSDETRERIRQMTQAQAAHRHFEAEPYGAEAPPPPHRANIASADGGEGDPAPHPTPKATQTLTAANPRRRWLWVAAPIAAAALLFLILFLGESSLPGHEQPATGDLCASKNGKVRYFTIDEWESEPDQSAWNKMGIYVSGNGERFLLDLHDNGRDITWYDAMKLCNLPTYEQGKVMADNYETINSAIRKFAYDNRPEWLYWTKTDYEQDSLRAWTVIMNNGAMYDYIKDSDTFKRARGVLFAPVASAI